MIGRWGKRRDGWFPHLKTIQCFMHINLPSYYKLRAKNTTELKTGLKTDLIIFLLSACSRISFVCSLTSS